MAHAIDFRPLDRLRALEDGRMRLRRECDRQLSLALGDLASVILRLAGPDGPWELSPDTVADLTKIRDTAGGTEDMSWRISCVDVCMCDDEGCEDPDVLELFRTRCPQAYAYWRLWWGGLHTLV